MRLPLLFSSILCLVWACTAKKQPTNTVPAPPPPSGLSGQELAIAHCGSCHAMVGPELLPKANWRDVLPAMGHRLGMYSSGVRPDSLFDAGVSGDVVRAAHIYPEGPILAPEDWTSLVNYYQENAPESLPPPLRKKPIQIGLKQFKSRETTFSHRPALTSMVKILPDNRGIVFGDGKGGRSILTFLTPELREKQSILLETTPIQWYEKGNALYLTTVGRGVYPTDAANGAMLRLTKSGTPSGYAPGQAAIPNLRRPVHMAYGDLNQDGHDDVVACEYGHHTGHVAWYQANGRGGYDKRVLREKPGAITAIIKDANRDGLPDVYVLMAQGDEGVFLYENQGGGTFVEKRLLSFLPLNGSQYMELADFNKDGYDDIVYVCGDNADKSPILKPYHGIYIYLNDQKNNFVQAYFYPLNGAYKAMARDYDQDGDLDIAAISFFPDYLRYPEESFVYLKNKGSLEFEEYSFPGATRGRWAVMDAADMDADGDIDLVLGSFVSILPQGDTTGLGKKWLSDGPSVMVLENTLR